MKHNWIPKKLDDVLELNIDAVPIEPTTSYKFAGVYCFGKGLFEREELFGANTSYKNLNRLHKDHITISKVKGWEGAIALISEQYEGMFLSPQYPTFRVKDEKETEIKFIGHFLMQENVWKVLLGKSVGIGARRNSISEDKFLNLSILLPLLPEQQRIVSKIESVKTRLDEALRLKREIIEETILLEKNLYEEKFNELLSLYENVSVGDVINLSSGKGITSSEIQNNLGEYAVYGGGGFIGRCSKYFLEEATIAIGRVGHRCGCIFKTESKSWISDNALYVTKFIQDIDTDYLVFVLSILNLRQFANKAAQPVVSQKKIYPKIIPLPDIVTQRLIISEINHRKNKLNNLKTNHTETEKELTELMPTLLDRAFKGEL
jgi:type I restriction enzyme S subunit